MIFEFYEQASWFGPIRVRRSEDPDFAQCVHSDEYAAAAGIIARFITMPRCSRFVQVAHTTTCRIGTLIGVD